MYGEHFDTNQKKRSTEQLFVRTPTFIRIEILNVKNKLLLLLLQFGCGMYTDSVFVFD